MAKVKDYDFNYPEQIENTYDCKDVMGINIIYDGNIEDNFSAVSYSGSTLSINLCGEYSFNFTNVKDPSSITFQIKKSQEALEPGKIEYFNELTKFLELYGYDPEPMGRGKTINIDMNYPNGKTKTYNCKGVTDLNVTFDSEIAPGPDNNFTSVTLSGSTLIIKVCNLVTYKFTNISSLDDINLKVTRSAGAVIPGDVQFDNSLKYFCDTYIDWVPTKGTKVTGSNFGDNIVLGAYTGTKGLTVNGGKGDDYIEGTIKSDTINGGDGNDIIYGAVGSDKLTGGKGHDTFEFNLLSAKDVDTITDATVDDKIVIENINADDLTFNKNGNNLEITGEGATDKVVIQNYFKTKASKRVNELQAKDRTIYLANEIVNINGKGTIKGSDQNDSIMANDTDPSVKANNDKITGGTGDDIINAGSGYNTICYSLGHGNDTILYGGLSAHDTLSFDKGITVSAEMSGDDLLVKYSGTKNKVFYENTITVEDFKNNKSVEYISVGGKKASINEYLNGGGGGGTGGGKQYISTEKSEYWIPGWTPEYGAGAKLTEGNHTFIFDYKNVPDDADPAFGYGDIIMSPNIKASKSYTETFQLNSNSLFDHGWMDMNGDDITLRVYGKSSYLPDMLVQYLDVLPNNKPKIVVNDKDRSYDVHIYDKPATVIDNTKGSLKGKNNVSLLTARKLETNPNFTVIGNSGYNYTSCDRNGVNYTYNGGHDRIITDEYAYTNDTYTLNSFTKDSYLRIAEGGGKNDVLDFNYAGATADDVRIIFDVTQFGDNLIGSRDNMRMFFAHKDALTNDDKTLAKILASDDQAPIDSEVINGSAFVVDLPQVQENSSNIETIKINGVAVNTEAWYDAVQLRLGQILRYEEYVNKIGYGDITYALTWDECPISEEQKEHIINAYRTLKYSDIVQQTVSAGGEVNLAANKFNRYTFDGNYDGAVINSGNTKWNDFGDTLIFKDSSFGDGSLSLKLVDGAAEGKKDLCITSNGKTVKYTDYMTGNNADLILIDKDNRKVSVQEFTDNLPMGDGFSCGDSGNYGTYNAIFVNNNGDHLNYHNVTFSVGGKSHNYIYTTGGVPMEYSQTGVDCHSTVVSAYNDADDKYNASLTTHLMIEDHGGEDRIQITANTAEDWNKVGIVANVTVNYENDEWVKSIDRNHMLFVDKGSLTADSINAATRNTLVDTIGINVLDAENSGGIEHISNSWYYDAVDANNWYDGVKESVASWLIAANYGSVKAAIDAYNTNPDAVNINGLINAFTAVNGSDYVVNY